MIENGTHDVGLKDGCYESCRSVKYIFKLLENSILDTKVKLDSYGEKLIERLTKSERLYWDIADGKIFFNLELDVSLKQKLQKMSLIHINFEESEVWRVTKDAKITMPGMIASIGGTLGLLIGFSFLGLLDTFTGWLQYFKRKLGKLEAEAKAKAEAEGKAKKEAEAKVNAEADKKAKLEAEANTKVEAEEKAKKEAEAKAKEEADKKAKLEAEVK